MKVPSNLKYTKDHEWLKTDSGSANIAVIGITDFAQHELGDIVFVDLPESGKTLKKGDVFGVVESVKTVSDLFLPVDGKVLEVNQELKNHPEQINLDPYGKAWMIKIEVSAKDQIEALLDAKAYEDIVQGN